METKQAHRWEDAAGFFKRYYERTSVLVTQIPYELREILLPKHMLFGRFKATLHFDATGRLAFEITRKRSSRTSIKPKEDLQRIESVLLGKLGKQNLLFIQGRNTVLRDIVLTHADFASRFPHKLPDGSVLNFGMSGNIGPMEVAEEADVKLVDVRVCWLIDGKPFVKDIPFAWLLGKADLLDRGDASAIAEGDFYTSLFSSVQYLVTQGYKKLGPDTKRKALELYSALLSRVEEQLRNSFRLTGADERTFHQVLEKYRFFICPQATSIESEVTIDNHRVDFLVRVGSHDIILLEIEPAHSKPFIGCSSSSRLEGALQQVTSWKEGSKKREEFLGKHVSFWILIGLLEDMTEDEKTCLERFNRDTRDVAILTYDHMIQSVQSTRQLLDKLRE